jgi:hypothetical protein
MVKLAKPGDFCPNKECPDYEKLQSASQHNIIKAGKTKASVQPAIAHLQRQKARYSTANALRQRSSWKPWRF